MNAACCVLLVVFGIILTPFLRIAFGWENVEVSGLPLFRLGELLLFGISAAACLTLFTGTRRLVELAQQVEDVQRTLDEIKRGGNPR
jgi:hypothetical protein